MDQSRRCGPEGDTTCTWFCIYLKHHEYDILYVVAYVSTLWSTGNMLQALTVLTKYQKALKVELKIALGSLFINLEKYLKYSFQRVIFPIIFVYRSYILKMLQNLTLKSDFGFHSWQIK